MKQERFKCIAGANLVLVRDEKILLLQRSGTGYRDGDWGLPGGHIEQGETMIETIMRETIEEISIDIFEKKLVLKHEMRLINISNKEYAGKVAFFIANNWQGEIRNMEPEKCSDLQWFPIDKLPENTIPYVRHAIDCIQKGVTYSEFGWK